MEFILFSLYAKEFYDYSPEGLIFLNDCSLIPVLYFTYIKCSSCIKYILLTWLSQWNYNYITTLGKDKYKFNTMNLREWISGIPTLLIRSCGSIEWSDITEIKERVKASSNVESDSSKLKIMLKYEES